MLLNNKILKRNNVKRFGSGNETIMFAHGYGCDQNMWRFITPAFEDKYQIVLFDHTGSGKSDESSYDFDKYNSLKGYAEDVVHICDALDLKKVIFVGHSVSAMIGVLSAIEKPNLFSKLILMGPSPCYINREDYYGGFSQSDIDELIDTLESNYLGWSSAITPVITGNPDKPEISEELHNSFCRMNPEIAKHFARVTFLSDNREDLQKVTVPCLIIQSDPDMIAPVQVGKYVHKQLSGSVFVKIDTPGHCPHLTAPELTIQAITSYLE